MPVRKQGNLPFKILDCTLRDGGYYTNWDFDHQLVNAYLTNFNQLPVDYLEIGYRSNPMTGYLGEYFYCPLYVLETARTISNKKLVIILNEKDVKVQNIPALLDPCTGIIDMVRIALDPDNLSRALLLAEAIKKMGFEVGFNVMYMSKWGQYNSFLEDLKHVDAVADYFYMVDSYGGVYPEDIIRSIDLVRSRAKCKIGFHGHNNLELALINSLTALDAGAEIIDATVLGMGRGAGNLKTELLLTALNKRDQLPVDFNVLGNLVNAFSGLYEYYAWGTNLPYMISGSNSLPQKDVMEWVTRRFYSFNSIIRALNNQKDKLPDNEKLEVFAPQKSYTRAIIIGGGPNAVHHSKAIKEFLTKQGDSTCLIHASSKNASCYQDVIADQYFCLVGNEGYRLEQVFSSLSLFKGQCVLPPFPRKMGTYIPDSIKDDCFELSGIDFTDKLNDSHTALALQTAKALGVSEVLLVGYDGYQDRTISQLERTLSEENEFLFLAFKAATNIKLNSLTPSNYKSLSVQSVYSYLVADNN